MDIRAVLCTALVVAGAGTLVVLDLNRRSPEAPLRERPEPTAQAEYLEQVERRPRGSRGDARSEGGSDSGAGSGPGEGAPPRRWAAPNGRWSVVRDESNGEVALVDGNGRTLDEIPNFLDGGELDITWSPRSDWFYVNQPSGRAWSGSESSRSSTAPWSSAPQYTPRQLR